jgi:hypothetical protein
VEAEVGPALNLKPGIGDRNVGVVGRVMGEHGNLTKRDGVHFSPSDIVLRQIFSRSGVMAKASAPD